MGGRAFFDIINSESKRMDKDEYDDVLALTIARINNSHDMTGIAKGVLSVDDKETFGDIDILVVREFFFFHFFWNDNKHRYKAYKQNGGVISLLDKQDRQIDLITTPKAIYETHYDYLNYNDLGNFVGRIAKSINLKYGHDGLHLIVRDANDNTRKIGEICVSVNTMFIYQLLDIEPPHRTGYYNMEDIFDMIMDSKYYHKDLFLLEKQSHKARVRDRKRKSYNAFLKYIEENDTSTHTRRRYSIFETLDKLPARVGIDYIKQRATYDNKQYEKTLFNGNIVRELTGLQGKELGAFIGSIKEQIDIYGDIDKQINALYIAYTWDNNTPNMYPSIFKVPK